jgi:hypothetical protein
MLSEKEIRLLYETLLSAPGMNEVVKLDVKVPRKMVLLLVKLLEKGLQIMPGETEEGLLHAAGEGSLENLRQISIELLHKAGLSEMNEKLHTLRPAGK